MESAIERNRLFRVNDRFKEWIVLTICLVRTFLFLFSAYEKVIDHDRFAKGLSKVSIISSYSTLIAWAVPTLEILVSILLIIPKTHRWGLYGFTGLMLVCLILKKPYR
ncbi:MauE/DoxX family redox-associated membrane protein [Pedobacter sp. UYP1]|uniref:MauE/DoxX family redox-associated membrane protein n=1 Tax=Pedobacter sp. UYP1 TaxID=1756396 RepID=UPI003392A6A4